LRSSLVFALTLCFALAGCTDDTALLYVDLQTDLVPGVEFTFVETRVEPFGGGPAQTTIFGVSADQDFVDVQRVAIFDGVAPGRYVVTVALRDPLEGDVVARTVDLVVSDNYAVTVVATRSCRDVDCGAGQTCASGRCVDPACSVQTPERCPAPACSAPADCDAPTATCAEARCVSGECLDVERSDSMCTAEQFCQPESGCAERPTVMTPDAGVPDAGPGDAGPVDAGPVLAVPGPRYPARGDHFGLISRADGFTALSDTRRPKLAWRAIAGADYYHLQVSTESTFATLALEEPRLEVDIYTVPEGSSGLDAGRYYWRVEACVDGGECSGFLAESEVPYFYLGLVREDVDGVEDGVGDVLVGAPISGSDGGGGGLHRGEVSTWHYSSSTMQYSPPPVGIAETTGFTESELGRSIVGANLDAELSSLELAAGAPQHGGGQGLVMIFQSSRDRTPGTAGPLVREELRGPDGPIAGSRFGTSLAAGDLDGDGYDDLVVGQPGTAGGSFAGRVVIYWGGPTPTVIDEARSLVLSAGEADDGFGEAVAVVGDIERDGYVDLVIGAPRAAGPGGRPGRVYVHHGGADARTALAGRGYDIDIPVAMDGARFGAAIAGIEDADHDAYPDVLVGAPGFDGDRGAVFILYGSDDTFGPGQLVTGTPSTIDPPFTPSPGAQWGFAVAGGGDFDGNGLADWVISAPGQGNGVVYYYAGIEGGTRGGPLSFIANAPEQLTPSNDDPAMRFGECLVLSVDRSGDGHADIIVGAPAGENRDAADSLMRGFVNVFLGQPGALPVAPLVIEGRARDGYAHVWTFGAACR